MGRIEIPDLNDYERALVGYGTSSARAKWRAPRSARITTLKKYLTASALLETPVFANYWKSLRFDTKVNCVDRPIRPNEVEVLNWLLDHALIDVTAYRRHPVEELRVVRECGCGCASLYFKSNMGDLQRVADELAVYPDGQQAGLMLWGRDGEIVLLEVYDFEPESSHRAPHVSNLCTWEDLGRRDLERAKRSHPIG